MLRRPQRTEDRLRAGGEDGAYLCGALEGWGELNQWPRAQPSGSRLGLKREHGAYRGRCFRSRSTARELAAARGVRRSNARACARCRCRRAVAVSTGKRVRASPAAAV